MYDLKKLTVYSDSKGSSMIRFSGKSVHCLRTEVLLFVILISLDLDALAANGVEASAAETVMRCSGPLRTQSL